ncbi:hypothetical protein [Effusibacillus consociatus]|uniref:Uncharacterized protein n=1 Tax=Effusibacillus consociatus TaxID=1117041 RepID=A0ABV9PZL2_9BACL
MALREDEAMNVEEVQELDEGSIFADWFWRPLKRHETKFLESRGERTGWRESGRRLQIAARVSSHLDSKQARLAYLYDREGERGHSYREAANQMKGRTKW